jgi:LPS O-antigen subunit length determinant protein (WzzB/FepE family)
MTENKMDSLEISSINLLEFIFKRRKELFIIGLIAAVVSAIASFVITPKFKSTVIMFPTQTSSISKALLAENSGKDDILKFGEEEEAEQMLQILNSDQIQAKVCEKFNLLDHYNIDKSDPFKYTKLYDEFKENISYERTEFMSVKIEVLDKDPQLAANICNTISELMDSVKNGMQKERAVAGLRIVERSYLALKDEIRGINDSLKSLRMLGINDYETQSQVFNEQYATAIAKNNSSGAKLLEEKLKILSTYGGSYVSLRELHEAQIKQLALIKAKYEEAKVDAEQILTQKFIVNKATKAEKKSYPIRWLIVVISTFSALIFGFIVLLLMENLGFAIQYPQRKISSTYKPKEEEIEKSEKAQSNSRTAFEEKEELKKKL